MMPKLSTACLFFFVSLHLKVSGAFLVGSSNQNQQLQNQPTTTTLASTKNCNSNNVDIDVNFADRRQFLQKAVMVTAASSTIFSTEAMISPAFAGTFTPGGTLVERDVGATVGNPEASPSRKFDNANVLFGQDHYFKFGVAAPWIEAGSTEFPKTMPFTLSQQRYDALKKYGTRVAAGAKVLDGLGDVIMASSGAKDFESRISEAAAPEYALRPMGLMANGFLASENTGTTNELLLARWYINEIYLDIGDMRSASSPEEAMKSYIAAKKAANSYLNLLNRVITSKIGDKFELLTI
mmetsp:Transcript_5915/g.8362  ORF Transcript_5915/g.8362 Transcript_5915/m.8362 type:complete len:295 (-) Transcript_5915:36-920(-)